MALKYSLVRQKIYSYNLLLFFLKTYTDEKKRVVLFVCYFQSMVSNLFSNNQVVNQTSYFCLFFYNIHLALAEEDVDLQKKNQLYKVGVYLLSHKIKTFISYPCSINISENLQHTAH